MTEASCIDRSSGAAGLPDTSKTNTTNKSTTTNTTAADKPSLVIIGNGMAPGRMLEHLIENGNPYDVTIFNAEPRVNYNRLMLSYVLDGNKTYDDIITHGEDWYIEHGITLHKAAPVTTIDTAHRMVHTASGIDRHYDKLVIATGSSPFVLPIPGTDLHGVLTYRDLDDVERMLSVAAESHNAGHTLRAVVIGGGLLGLEAASGLLNQGMQVTVLHLMDTLMEKQLDQSAGWLLGEEFSSRGVQVLTGVQSEAIIDNGKGGVAGVTLADGRTIAADLVVMAVGIRPSTTLAQDAGIEVDRGIVVDDQMQTSEADIYALGECAQHNNEVYGLVAPLYDMASVLADNLTGTCSTYAGSVTATRLKVDGVSLYSAGDFTESADTEEIVLRDASAGIYKRLVLKDNKITGAVLYGETSDGPWFFDLLKRGVDISELRDTLIFGQSFQGGPALNPLEAVAALPDNAEICGCNGIDKGTICSAITDGAVTLDTVRACTKASSSCGTCTGLVEQLLTLKLGSEYQPAAVTPVCPCTDYGHDDIRRLIRAQSLRSIPAIMQQLQWKTSCGCAKCRPALNYYLVCEYPSDYKDDYQSRFINERAHANIQKDGTYSIVPRMWGGETSSLQLRTIADVVDKYNIPTVKVTGGQRIDMLGIKKEDLIPIWKDLGSAGFVSGHAYAKGLRTVKTCVGTDWCRFGTQDSTGLGIKIEKFMWGSWTPAKVKMAVSGCPRNCAEATCKDVGVICVDSGYEIHFAGAAGLDIKGTELLGHADNEDDVIEIIAAVVQMYREQGHYLERIYKWARRVGVDEVKAQIIEDHDKRLAYFDRFCESQKVAQVDPWAERVSGTHEHEFTDIVPLPVRQTTALRLVN
jgi:nitrite reductase (NADH) large subunit